MEKVFKIYLYVNLQIFVSSIYICILGGICLSCLPLNCHYHQIGFALNTGCACLILHVILTIISYTGTLFKVRFHRILLDSGFGFNVYHYTCICMNTDDLMESKVSHYSITRFFSGVHACVNGADALTN
jgi:hypothetical protein